MMFARIDQRPVARWWWTVDRWTLGALLLLIGFGAVMSMAASPAVAERLGYAPMHFAERSLATVPVALAIMFGVSLLSPRTIRRIAFIGFGVRRRAVAADLCDRRRDQGRATLDQLARTVVAAVGIR